MRQLAETERLLVEKIVQLKQAARLEELQVARLLRKELECFALRWVLEPCFFIPFKIRLTGMF